MSGILEWYRNGGPIMHFILLVGIIGLAVFLERLYFIVIKSNGPGTAVGRIVLVDNWFQELQRLAPSP